jgi:hypothetical protein
MRFISLGPRTLSGRTYAPRSVALVGAGSFGAATLHSFLGRPWWRTGEPARAMLGWMVRGLWM